MKTSDKILLEAIANKDKNSFNEFYERYSSLLYRWSFNRVGSVEASNDISQDFWSSLWVNSCIIKTNDEGSAKNFLLSFFTFRILDYLRVQKNREKLLDYNEQVINLENKLSYSHILEEIQENEIHFLIDQVLESLPELTRKIFICRWKFNYSIKEIASQLNITEKIVYNRNYIALEAIRSKVREIYSLMNN